MRVLLMLFLIAAVARGQGMFLPVTTLGTAIVINNGKTVPTVVSFTDGTMTIRFQCLAFIAKDKTTDDLRIELEATQAFVADQPAIPLQQVFAFDQYKMMGFPARPMKVSFFESLAGGHKKYVLFAGQAGFLHILTPAGLSIPASVLSPAADQ